MTSNTGWHGEPSSRAQNEADYQRRANQREKELAPLDYSKRKPWNGIAPTREWKRSQYRTCGFVGWEPELWKPIWSSLGCQKVSWTHPKTHLCDDCYKSHRRETNREAQWRRRNPVLVGVKIPELPEVVETQVYNSCPSCHRQDTHFSHYPEPGLVICQACGVCVSIKDWNQANRVQELRWLGIDWEKLKVLRSGHFDFQIALEDCVRRQNAEEEARVKGEIERLRIQHRGHRFAHTIKHSKDPQRTKLLYLRKIKNLYQKMIAEMHPYVHNPFYPHAQIAQLEQMIRDTDAEIVMLSSKKA